MIYWWNSALKSDLYKVLWAARWGELHVYAEGMVSAVCSSKRGGKSQFPLFIYFLIHWCSWCYLLRNPLEKSIQEGPNAFPRWEILHKCRKGRRGIFFKVVHPHKEFLLKLLKRDVAPAGYYGCLKYLCIVFCAAQSWLFSAKVPYPWALPRSQTWLGWN